MSKVLAASFTLSRQRGRGVPLRQQATAKPNYYDARGQVAARAVPPRAARVPPHLEHLRHAPPSRSSASGRRTRAPTTPRRPARPFARSATASWSRAGWAGGYGNVRRGPPPQRLRDAVRPPARVRQGRPRRSARGDRADRRLRRNDGPRTAPHLHFEVLVGGVQRDSRSALRAITGFPIERQRARRLRARFASSCSPRSSAHAAACSESAARVIG